MRKLNGSLEQEKTGRQINEDIHHYFLSMIKLAVISGVMIFLTETVYLGSFVKASEWFWNWKWNTLANIGIVLFFLLLLFHITGSEIFSTLVTGSILLSGLIASDLKYQAKGEVLKLSDLSSFGEAIQVMGNYEFHMPPLCGMFLLFTLFVIAILLLTRYKFHCRYRFYRGLLSCILAVLLILFSNYARNNLLVADGRLTVARTYYQANGFLLGLLNTLPRRIREPEGYSEKLVQSILQQEEQNEIIQETGTDYPDIIVVMIESLYDLSRLDGVSFSRDPIGIFRKYQDLYVSGNCLSPVEGGGTCDTEYEVLTGYPTENTEGAGLIYPNGLIRKDPGTILDVLKASGYNTLAIHPNDRTFFNRSIVYEKMGFDRTRFLDSMETVTREGNWVSDETLYQYLIEEYEARDPEKPFFAFGITMEMHGGYQYSYTKHGISVTGEGRSGEELEQLTTFVNLEYDSLQAFKDLLEYFSAVDRDVIVAAFGDHIPGTSGFGGFEMDLYTKQTTPLLIWDNYSGRQFELGEISAYKIGGALLQYAGVPLDAYFSLVMDPAVPNGTMGWFYTEDGWRQKADLPDISQDALDRLWVLQYDRMFGENYGKTIP